MCLPTLGQEFLLTLEGMFRSLEGEVKRDDASLLHAFEKARLATRGNYLEDCRDHCTWNKGNNLRKAVLVKCVGVVLC